ncbi:Ran-binding protein M-like [Citrus sinensis]|uniref:Ran-binding protein M-like n=1 Tax=Citrus sinensis TaxID=2711 RepID=A0ACB8KUE5_CITSI|nr:Ran-binding protein M-like [Citrus sinensis]
MSTNNTNNIKNEDLGLHFLALARASSSSMGGKREEEDFEEEEVPTELNTINSSGGFLVVSPDKLSVKYTSVNLHGHDVGVVQANKPAPVKRLVYYFEIYVKDAGAKGQIAIGFTSESFKMRRQPGWEANSCGYHGDDGLLYRGQGKGEAFGPTFTTNDTVGGGINYASQEFFFTSSVQGHQGSLVSDHCCSQPKRGVVLALTVILFLLSIYISVLRLVRSYLQHYGYEDTLNSFDLAGKTTVPPVFVAQENGFNEQDNVYALNQRKTLRQLIRNGEIDAAFDKLRNWHPWIVQDDKSSTCFLLHCQKFIELVRVGALEEAVKYGRMELAKYFGLAGFEELVQDCVALLAYEKPQESSVGYLLEDSQREIVADTVNAMILSTNPNVKDLHGCLHSCLERLLRQLTACCLERRSMNGDQGEAFHLHRVLNSGKKAKC